MKNSKTIKLERLFRSLLLVAQNVFQLRRLVLHCLTYLYGGVWLGVCLFFSFFLLFSFSSLFSPELQNVLLVLRLWPLGNKVTAK